MYTLCVRRGDTQSVEKQDLEERGDTKMQKLVLETSWMGKERALSERTRSL
jgi:hypothetical protein